MKGAGALRTAVGWLGGRGGYVLLTGGYRRLAGAPPERFDHAWASLLAAALLAGLAGAGVYDASWKLLPTIGGMRILQPAMLTLFWVAWPLREAVGALAWVLGRSPRQRQSIGAALVVLLFAALGSLSAHAHTEHAWPGAVAWMRPYVLYRPMLLMPLWGAWAMLVTVQFVRPAERTSPQVERFARTCGALTTAAVMGVLLLGTVQYFAFLPWEQLIVSGAGVLSGAVGGAAICGGGRLTRRRLLATNLLTQLVFLLTYLGVHHWRFGW